MVDTYSKLPFLPPEDLLTTVPTLGKHKYCDIGHGIKIAIANLIFEFVPTKLGAGGFLYLSHYRQLTYFLGPKLAFNQPNRLWFTELMDFYVWAALNV
jgi:hypothetical protein